jgi:site-specific DNA recombinase
MAAVIPALRGEQLRIFIYLRVSTDDQEDNTSLEQQEIDCRDFCEIGNHYVVGVFQDVYTGSVWRERKDFMKMRARYLAGEADAVVVRTYSRFTRMIADYYVLTHEMQEYNVKLVCVKEQYDDTPLGHMLQAIQMGFNEQERETTRQRTMDGKRARVTNKKLYLAGKKPPYGLKFDDEKVKGKLVENEEETPVVRDILHMRAQKQTVYAITKYLSDNNIPSPGGGAWNERSVRMIIERAADMYRGIAYAYKYEFTKEYRNGKLTTVKRVRPVEERLLLPEGTVPRIIDDATAFLALAAAGINAQESTRNNPNAEDTLLRSGHIRCGLCGNLMSMRRHHKPQEDKTYLIYRCSGTSRAVRVCEHMEISAPKIDKIVWDYACNVIRELEIIETAVNTVLELDMFVSPEKAAIKAIGECEALIEQYREDLKTTGLSKGTRTVLLEDLSKQTDLLEELERELIAIQSGKLSFEKVIAEYRAFVEWCQDFKRSGQENASYRQKRDALRFLGITTYIYKHTSPHGQYVIRLAPPQLMSSLRLLPKSIEETLSRDQVHRVSSAPVAPASQPNGSPSSDKCSSVRQCAIVLHILYEIGAAL